MQKNPNVGGCRGALLHNLFPQVAALLFLCTGSSALYAQAPSLLWSTNIGARVFAMDEQTNVYANAGGTVYEFSGAGALLESNAICPLPAVAQRDATGNFYFGGSFDGTQDFGGITLVGGWTNGPGGGFTPGWPSCFVAKYNGNGALQWVVSFGHQSYQNMLTDLLVQPDGASYIGYLYSGAGAITRLSPSGGNPQWEAALDETVGQSQAVTLGGLTTSNCCYFLFRNYSLTGGGRVSSGGSANFWGNGPLFFSDETSMNGRPVIDDQAQAFQAGDDAAPAGPQVLKKFAVDGSVLWNVPVGGEKQWTLARDPQSQIYLGGVSGLLSKYDANGVLIWTNNYGHACIRMVVDGSGNRFVSFADGSLARLQSDAAPEAPMITEAPLSQTLFVGDNVTMSVAATGTPPLHYFWRLNGTNISNATGPMLTLSNVSTAAAGSYSVIVSNVADSATSAPPAVLRVKSVEIYLGNQLLTNGTYTFSSSPTLSVRSAFAGGETFYTLDGSTPSFSSTFYSGPFVLQHNATVQAIGYSADFLQSEQADAIYAIVLLNHTLTASATGGGSVSLNPPGGIYNATNIVSVTATPLPGWSFLYWLGDATGVNPSVNVSMESNKALLAVFGTSLSTTVAGSGQIQLNPPGDLYPYGSVVRLTAVPDAGNYFGFWGNAATGNTNPLYFTITMPTQTVSSIFGGTPAGQAALTLLIDGGGRLNANPLANIYSLNQSVTLTAVPDPGQSFLNWTGDAAGTQNPLNVSMDQSKVITANFSARPTLSVDRSGIEGPSVEGFRLTLISESPSIWQILVSSNLLNWQGICTVSNQFGEVQFTDTNAPAFNERFYKASP